MSGRAPLLLLFLCWWAWLGCSVDGVTFFASTKHQEENVEPTPRLNDLSDEELQDVVKFCYWSKLMSNLPPIVHDGCAAFLRSLQDK